jgi:putative FmdB family regulatory protein
MPTYDYVCDACGHKFEMFQAMKDDPIKKCPECKKNKLRRLIGAGAGVVFKGSGFYQTDYRSESYKKQASADKSAGDSSGGEKKSGDKSSDAGKSSGEKSGGESKSSDAPAQKSAEPKNTNKKPDGR